MKVEYEIVHRHDHDYLNDSELQEMIAVCAYYKAEKRGFETGFELQDWLEAEQEICKRCYYWFQEI